MKVFPGRLGDFAKVGLLFLFIFATSCNTLKRVGEDQFLLTENTILADDKKVNISRVKNLINQRPNSNILGYPFRLNLHNLAKPNPSADFEKWLRKKEKREQRLQKTLSKKQVNRLSQSFLVTGVSDLLKRLGEPPVIIDTLKTRKSAEVLSAYYYSKGYFNSSTTYDIVEQKKGKRAEIVYKVDLGKPYVVDSLQVNIVSTQLDSLYRTEAENSYVKTGKQFDASQFAKERERLVNQFRNSGIHNFQESSINFKIYRDTTVVSDNQEVDVLLNILEPRSGRDTLSSKDYAVHKLGKINIYPDYNFVQKKEDLQALEYNNYTIHYKDKLAYKPKALTDAVFLVKDSVYRDINRIRTYQQISNLNTFKYPNIEFITDSTANELTTNIYLAPRPKYSLNADFDVTHSNIQQIGTAFTGTLVSRNVFGGAENLNISARGSIGLLSDASQSSGTFTSEIGGDINITFPRILLPFNTEKIIPYYTAPQTRLSIGTNFQRNIGLDKQSLNAILAYNWSISGGRNALELLNIEFVRNVNSDNFFNVFGNTFSNLDDIADDFDDPNAFPELADFFETVDNIDDSFQLSIPDGADGFINAIENGVVVPADAQVIRDVQSIAERQQRLTENNLIFATNYTYTESSPLGINSGGFYQFRFNFESAGNTLSLIDNVLDFDQDDSDQSLLFNVPFSQYLKSEVDYIKHWGVSNSTILAFRSFFGIAVPIGNSTSIPFVRSYFAGGSNDNRAWNAYELGPGSTNNLNDFNEANLKLALNLEYRFPIAGDIKGALFADAGNIWNVFDNEDNPDAIFTGFDSLRDIGLGTGFGLRYDFTFFIFRLDAGFKAYNPQLELGDRWFTDFNFGNSVLNIGINYPF